MSHWSQKAQAKGGAGMGEHKAGDPIHGCVEHARLEPVLDFNEPTVLDPQIKAEPMPVLVAEVTVADPPPMLESDLRIHAVEEA